MEFTDIVLNMKSRIDVWVQNGYISCLVVV